MSAGDWIKVRTNLWDDPRVSRMVELTGTSEAAVIGGLYWLWATADQHTEDGVMPGLTVRQIDRKTGVPGLGDALAAVGWIEPWADGLRLIRFDEHNGASAKRRCSESRRKMSARDADKLRTESGQPAEETRTPCAPREDKRREELSTVTVDVVAAHSDAEASPKTRGTRLRAGWQLPREWGQWALEQPGWTDPAVRLEAEKFRDFWSAKPGREGVKLDWQATWRNWIRNARPAASVVPLRQNAQIAIEERNRAVAAEWLRTTGVADVTQ